MDCVTFLCFNSQNSFIETFRDTKLYTCVETEVTIPEQIIFKLKATL